MKLLHTMIRVKDLEKSLHFYTKLLQMQVVKRKDYPEGQFTLVFLGYKDQEVYIELTYNWDNREYQPGNAFGHLAFGHPDIFGLCENLEQEGVQITRKPGLMKGSKTILAFVHDPDGYSIELIQTAV